MLFKILKDDILSAALNTSANLEPSAVAAGLEKVSFHSNPKEKHPPFVKHSSTDRELDIVALKKEKHKGLR